MDVSRCVERRDHATRHGRRRRRHLRATPISSRKAAEPATRSLEALQLRRISDQVDSFPVRTGSPSSGAAPERLALEAHALGCRGMRPSVDRFDRDVAEAGRAQCSLERPGAPRLSGPVGRVPAAAAAAADDRHAVSRKRLRSGVEYTIAPNAPPSTSTRRMPARPLSIGEVDQSTRDSTASKLASGRSRLSPSSARVTWA